MKNQTLSIVIPVYNEQESLEELVRRINAALSDEVIEYVFVDDGSTDGSFETLVTIKKTLKHPMRIIRFRKNTGKSAALATGFEHATGDTIVTLDADLQDDPQEIPKLLRKLQEGYDMVVGWRADRRDKKNKIMVSFIFNYVVSAVGNVRLHDMNCGLKVFKKSVPEEVDLYGELHRFLPLLALTRGFKVTEVPVTHHARKFGKSKFGIKRIFAAFDLVSAFFVTSFKHRPLPIFGTVGCIALILGLIPLIYLSYLHFMGESIGRRPLLLMGILFVLFGVQIFSTGLLGELITNINARKQKYPIADTIE